MAELFKPRGLKEKRSDDASLAQLVEQGTLNPKVEGSNPSGPTNIISECSAVGSARRLGR